MMENNGFQYSSCISLKGVFAKNERGYRLTAVLALDFRTFLENVKMSSSLSKILKTGINVFKINYQNIKNEKHYSKPTLPLNERSSNSSASFLLFKKNCLFCSNSLSQDSHGADTWLISYYLTNQYPDIYFYNYYLQYNYVNTNIIIYIFLYSRNTNCIILFLHLQGVLYRSRAEFKGTVSLLQVTLHAKMAMPDLQQYPLQLCLIKYEIELHIFVSENC